mmetsp:Transcript_10190/g.27052  ORF Transcript_10190/g.27052 Transcript_10190/m.27052 type:complete len:86 (+) Transcript_10190:670-927(+)
MHSRAHVKLPTPSGVATAWYHCCTISGSASTESLPWTLVCGMAPVRELGAIILLGERAERSQTTLNEDSALCKQPTGDRNGWSGT